MGILEVKDVNKRFGGLQALGDVNLCVAENTVHAIIGPNGAGKSTLLNCLVGKLIPDTGSVMFDGQSVLGRKPYEINQMGITRVFQTPEIFGDLTVLENVMIPCFAKRDGAFRMHAFESVASERDMRRAGRADAGRRQHGRQARTCMRPRCRAATSGGWKWRCAWCRSRTCCCWTSRPPAWRAPTPTTPSTC